MQQVREKLVNLFGPSASNFFKAFTDRQSSCKLNCNLSVESVLRFFASGQLIKFFLKQSSLKLVTGNP